LIALGEKIYKIEVKITIMKRDTKNRKEKNISLMWKV